MARAIYKKKRYYFLIIFIGLMMAFYKFSEFRSSDSSFTQLFESEGYESYKVDRVEHADRVMRYVWAGSKSKPALIMIHGSPSSSAFWKAFFRDSTLRSEYRLVAVDRPGYGFSNFGTIEPDIEIQAELVEEVIREIDEGNGVYMLASSYGGPVAAKAAMDLGDEVDGVIFQSSSLIPGEETTYKFTHWTKPQWIANLLPTTIRMANEEKLSHRAALTKIEDGWSKIRSHIVFLHGADDGLVYPTNSKVASKRSVNAKSNKIHIFPGRGHDLYWTERPALIDQLVNLKRRVIAYEHARNGRDLVGSVMNQ